MSFEHKLDFVLESTSTLYICCIIIIIIIIIIS